MDEHYMDERVRPRETMQSFSMSATLDMPSSAMSQCISDIRSSTALDIPAIARLSRIEKLAPDKDEAGSECECLDDIRVPSEGPSTMTIILLPTRSAIAGSAF